MAAGLYLVIVQTFVCLAIALVCLCIYQVVKDTDQVYDELDQLLRLAQAADNRRASGLAELASLRRKLVAFHNNRCWHKHHGAKAREVLAYIDGRLACAK